MICVLSNFPCQTGQHRKPISAPSTQKAGAFPDPLGPNRSETTPLFWVEGPAPGFFQNTVSAGGPGRTATPEGKLGIRSIQATIDNLRMRWAGHVARMPETRLPRRFLTSWVRAKCRPGRPNFSTVQCISDTIQRAGIDISKWVDYAGDREAWRAITAAVKPKPARKPLQTEIEIGPDGAQERCFNCKRGGKALVVCDGANCTAVWHERCLSAIAGKKVTAATLPDVWFCPLCTAKPNFTVSDVTHNLCCKLSKTD